LIGGAPRSGTTWLYAALDRHPAIYMAKPIKPEPKFFLVDELYEKGLAHYATTWFGDVPAGRIAGEKSTDYLESATAAERIGRDLPDARLVFILREPVDRAYSNYLWTRMNGLEHESFADALALEEERERTLPPRLTFARPYSYFSRGLYADLLQPYVDRFAPDRLLVLKFEDLAERPRALLETLHAFLGVDVRPTDADGLGVVNAAERHTADRIPDDVRVALADRYREPNAQLARLLGTEFEWR
jgi:hypothetical protein